MTKHELAKTIKDAIANGATIEELAEIVIEENGPLAEWLDREKQVYLAHNGRDGTLDGFKEHVAKMFTTNPKLIGGMTLDDFANAVFVEQMFSERDRRGRRSSKSPKL